MSENAIEVRNLRKTFYGGIFGGPPVHAVADVTFDVKKGTIFGLLGPNGAGKTTLIKILLGLVYKTSGDASLLGHSAGSRIGRGLVGYLPEHHRIPRHLTGYSALNYYGGLSGLSPMEVKARRDELLTRVGLEKWGKTSVTKYSKGMLQRLGLAQAMLHDPQLLILDEPTDGVDPVGRTEMRAILQQLKTEGKTIFLNSHLLQEIELVCDRVAILVQGQLRREGAVDEITRRNTADVEFTVQGGETVIREVFQNINTAEWLADANDVFRITVISPDQTLLNECIDSLRSRNVNILSVNRHRETLESAFLNIVADEPQTASAS